MKIIKRFLLIFLTLFAHTACPMEKSTQGSFFPAVMKTFENHSGEHDNASSKIGQLLTNAQEGVKDMVTQHPYITGTAIVGSLVALGWWKLSKSEQENTKARLHLNIISTSYGQKGYSFLNEGLDIPLLSKRDLKEDGLFSMLQLTDMECARLLSALGQAAVSHSIVHTTFNHGKSAYHASVCATRHEPTTEIDFYVKIKKNFTQANHNNIDTGQPKIAKNRMHFSLDENKACHSCLQEGDAICTLPELWSCVNFMSLLPLDRANCISLQGAFKLADAKQARVKRELIIKDKRIVAKIVPLKWDDECQTPDYFVSLVEKIQPPSE